MSSSTHSARTLQKVFKDIASLAEKVSDDVLKRSGNKFLPAVHKYNLLFLEQKKEYDYEDEEEFKVYLDAAVENFYNVARYLFKLLPPSKKSKLIPEAKKFCNDKPQAARIVYAIVLACMMDKAQIKCDERAEKANTEHWSEDYGAMSQLEYYERNSEMLSDALDHNNWRSFLEYVYEEDYAEAYAAYDTLSEFEYVASNGE